MTRGFRRTVWLFPAAFALPVAAIGGLVHVVVIAQQVFFVKLGRRRR